jgi:hypothetical protein
MGFYWKGNENQQWVFLAINDACKRKKEDQKTSLPFCSVSVRSIAIRLLLSIAGVLFLLALQR